MNQTDAVKRFCNDAKFHMIRFDSTGNEELGKILTENELSDIDLNKNEIHRSIEFKNGNTLFVYTLKPNESSVIVRNPLSLLIDSLKEARAIELVYNNIFTWVYDGLFLNALAIVPSGDMVSNSTISRYGGTEMFIKILNQHLDNIGKMHHGFTPDYNFLKNDSEVKNTFLSVGSINAFNSMYSIPITLSMDYMDIIMASKTNAQNDIALNTLEMKYWAREINPDFVVEAKHIRLEKSIDIDMEFKLYPPCVKELMNMKHKGNYNRFLLSRFLLNTHKPRDAKFIYEYVLSSDEREHIKTGNCSSQWNYILNSLKKYDCPTCKQMSSFCKKCGMSHPLENIQKTLKEGDSDE